MPSSQSLIRSSHDLPGRIVALLVFLIGVGILVFVFVTALHLFQSPVPGLDLSPVPTTPPPPAVNIGAAMAVFARSLLLLGVMTLAGSLLASKGAHLYFGTVYPPHEPPANTPSAPNGKSIHAGTSAEAGSTEVGTS